MILTRFVPQSPNPENIIQKFCAKSLKIPYATELLYLPFLLFRYRIVLSSFLGKERTEQGLFLADLVQGTPMNIKKNTVFDIAEDLSRDFEEFFNLFPQAKNFKNRVAIQKARIKEEQVLPIVLEEETALVRGKNLLRYDLMRVAGGLRFRKMEIIADSKRKILYYPYWLVYYRDKKDRMRFEVFDGLSGQKERGQIVKSIKIGLVKKGTPSKNSFYKVEVR
jgi:hypothetical protein